MTDIELEADSGEEEDEDDVKKNKGRQLKLTEKKTRTTTRMMRNKDFYNKVKFSKIKGCWITLFYNQY